jgi:hypothetical protein
MSSASDHHSCAPGTWIIGDWVKYRRSFGLHGYRLHTHHGYGYDNYVAKVWQNSYGGWEGTVESPTGEIRKSGWNMSRACLMRHTRQWAINEIVDMATKEVNA